MRWSLIAGAAVAAVSVWSNVNAQAAAGAAAACNLVHAPGVTAEKLTSGGRERTYRLFVPAGYDGRTALPLVLDLHGSGGTRGTPGREQPLRGARGARARARRDAASGGGRQSLERADHGRAPR